MSEDQRQVLSIGQIDEFRPLLIATQIPVPFSDDWDLQIDGAHEFARAIESATLAALAQQAQEPVANDRDCPHCNYTGSMHCGDVAKTHGGILNPEDCSHTKLFGSRITTPPAPQPAPVDERAEFEACAPMAGSLFKRRADDPDKYWDGNVQDDWELWQARAALQSPSPKTKGQP